MATRSLLSKVLGCLVAAGRSGVRPVNLGVRDGRLACCPETPNCVSSQARDARHAIAALGYAGTAGEAVVRLVAVIRGMDRARIVRKLDDYVYAEFTSALLGFVDDVEFHVDDVRKVIEVRSASRLGYSDFGVNRRRIETIRRRFAQHAHPVASGERT